jgi:hypothetical protein
MVSATLWGVGASFAPNTNGSILVLVLTPCLPASCRPAAKAPKPLN